MPYKHKRDCPVCDKPGLRYMSDLLRQDHHLYGDERRKWLGIGEFLISQTLLWCTTWTLDASMLK